MLTYSLHPDVTTEIRKKMHALREADLKRTTRAPKMQTIHHDRNILK